MMVLSKLGRKVFSFSKALQNPEIFKVRKIGGSPTVYEDLNTSWFKSLNIDTVLDIGANTGQFTKTISILLPNSKIYAFEPLPNCFDSLQKFANSSNNITVYNTGLGESSGSLSFEESIFSPSSSFLKMTDTHKNAFPHTNKTSLVNVKISRLDDIAKDLRLGSSILVKIDVQGYEDRVLKGGIETIKQAKVVIIETSFVKLYELQPLFDNIYTIFKEIGFTFNGVVDCVFDPISGQILQGDAIFMKNCL